MEHLTTKNPFAVILLLIFICCSLTSCYNDNEEDLYPSSGICNTENVSYSQTVWPIINNNCVSCHSGPNASGGVAMGNYTELVTTINGGRFIGAIKHEAGFSAMPKNASKLSDCSINQIEAWVAQGMINN